MTILADDDPKLSQGDRMLRALQAIATVMARQVNRDSGTPAARSYTVPVTTAIRIAPAYPGRRQLTLQNNGATTVTLAHDPNIAAGQGIQLLAGAVLSDNAHPDTVYKGEWWAISNAGGSVNVGVDDMGGS